MKPILTKKQQAKADRNAKIRFDYDTLTKIHGNSRWGVVERLAKKYKVSNHTILRCVK